MIKPREMWWAGYVAWPGDITNSFFFQRTKREHHSRKNWSGWKIIIKFIYKKKTWPWTLSSIGLQVIQWSWKQQQQIGSIWGKEFTDQCSSHQFLNEDSAICAYVVIMLRKVQITIYNYLGWTGTFSVSIITTWGFWCNMQIFTQSNKRHAEHLCSWTQQYRQQHSFAWWTKYVAMHQFPPELLLRIFTWINL